MKRHFFALLLLSTRGTLKRGMAADIIATPADPLQDIQTLKHVSFVMKDGVVIKNEAVARP